MESELRKNSGNFLYPSGTVKRMSMFLPSDIKLSFFNLLLQHFKDKKILAKEIGCSIKSLDKWSKGEIDDKYFSKILALALELPEAKSLLKESFNEITDLCTNLSILKEEKTSKVNQLMRALDEKSKEIIMHVWKNRYAKISEISTLISSPNDACTLTKIREVINPIAKNILGKPILLFEESKIDPITSNKVLFSWWLSDSIDLIKKDKEMLDVFNEENFLKIVTEMPNAKEKDIMIDINDEALMIYADTSDGRYHRKIPLFYAIDNIAEKTYKNGILEVKLKKTIGD
ncbi:MAG: hypothetical protein KKE50_00720 [Nanoarchaeota archaeon]|nr:hypothetical protein [Nanoarchaeota archaeon]